MTVLNIVEITSWIVGIISGVGGIIISFITMIKATNIERSIQKEKIDKGFKLDYKRTLIFVFLKCHQATSTIPIFMQLS